ADTIAIDANASLISFNNLAGIDSAGIPLGLHNQSTPADQWLPGMVYRDIPTTGGSGTGLRVDVTTDNYGNPTVVMRTPGTGYKDGDTITVSEPSGFLTGSTGFHNGSDITLQVNGLQTAGGDISLSALHHAEAISYSYNPIDVKITVAAGAVIRGRNVSIV